MQQTLSNLREMTPNKTHYVFTGLISIVSALATLLLIALLNGAAISTRPNTFFLSIANLVLALSVLWRGSHRKGSEALEIVYLITVMYILNYPLRALFILVWPDATLLPRAWPGDQVMAFALGLSLVGMLFFYLGYFWNASAHLLSFMPQIPFRWTSKHLSGKILLLYLIGLLALIVLFSEGSGLRFQWYTDRSNALDYMWLLLGGLRLYALFLAWTRQEKAIAGRILAYGLLASEISLGLFLGNKQAVLLALLAVLFAHHYVLRSRIYLIALIGGGIFLLILVPLIQTYRATYFDVLGFRPTPNLVDIAVVGRSWLDTTLDRPPGASILDTVKYVANRVSQLDSLTMVVSVVPSILDYQRGATLMNAVVGLVPRFLWPEKPVLNLGMFATEVIFGSRSVTNTPLTDIGEFYLNFGTFGVPIGMFLLGAFFRSVYVYTHRCNESSVFRALLYLAVLPQLLFAQTGVGGTLVALTRLFPLMLGVMWFLSLSPGHPLTRKK